MNEVDAPLPASAPLGPIMSLDDLQSRPRFKAPVDPKEHKLVEVLAQYSFAKLIPCGLSSCKQGHLHGFLVRTATGTETNIGHVCGKREFGQDFVMASAKFRRDEERRVTLGRVLALQGECNRVEALIHGLITRSFGVRWLFSVRDAVRARIGGPAYEHLKLRATRQEYKVTRVRELTDTEIKRAVDRTGLKREQVRYSTERLGELRPMDWMSWNFKDELLTAVRDEFRSLTTLAPSQMETKELKKRLKTIEGWETRINYAETVLSQVVRFLDPENLRLADFAVEDFRKAAKISGTLRPLAEWTDSEEYAFLMQGRFREGQILN